jgi:hypothetical protein
MRCLTVDWNNSSSEDEDEDTKSSMKSNGPDMVVWGCVSTAGRGGEVFTEQEEENQMNGLGDQQDESDGHGEGGNRTFCTLSRTGRCKTSGSRCRGACPVAKGFRRALVAQGFRRALVA